MILSPNLPLFLDLRSPPFEVVLYYLVAMRSAASIEIFFYRNQLSTPPPFYFWQNISYVGKDILLQIICLRSGSFTLETELFSPPSIC